MKKKKTPWDEIRNEYVTTNTSYRKLSEKYGIKQTRISERGKAEEWVSLREQYRAELGAAVKAAAIEEAVDKGMQAIREIGDVACSSINKLNRLIEDAPNGTQAEASVSALKALLQIIRDCYGILTTTEHARIEIDREKLKLEQDKVARSIPDENTDRIIIGSEVYGV